MLAVAGGKGGCGKTTTTLGLALAAGRRGRSVLAVDADVDVPDLHRVAGIADPLTERGPVDARADGGAGHHRRRPVPDAPGVDVLPARPGADPSALEERLAGQVDHDVVLLDCPAGAGHDAAVPLRAADRTLVVTTPRPPSLRDAAKTAAMSRAVGTPVAGAVVTRAERPPERVDRLLDTGTIEAIPRVDRPLDSPAAIDRFTRVLRYLSAV